MSIYVNVVFFTVMACIYFFHYIGEKESKKELDLLEYYLLKSNKVIILEESRSDENQRLDHLKNIDYFIWRLEDNIKRKYGDEKGRKKSSTLFSNQKIISFDGVNYLKYLKCEIKDDTTSIYIKSIPRKRAKISDKKLKVIKISNKRKCLAWQLKFL